MAKCWTCGAYNRTISFHLPFTVASSVGYNATELHRLRGIVEEYRGYLMDEDLSVAGLLGH